MHIPWDAVHLFLAMAETGSVSAAAKRLAITQPTASRRLAELEGQLGEPLFARSVTGVRPTPFGERLLGPARKMAEWAGEVDRAAERADAAPSGVVTVTAPPGIAYEFLAPFAAWLRKKLPGVTLEVIARISYVDLTRRVADLALRMGPVPSGLTTLATLQHGVAAFGTPEFRDALPPAPTVADVAWIAWAPPLGHLSPNPELEAMLPDFRPSFTSDDFMVQLRAAECGLGAIFLGRGRHRFSSSTLVELPLNLGSLTRTLSLVCAKSALDIPRVRAVADHLVAELAATREPPRLGQPATSRQKRATSKTGR